MRIGVALFLVALSASASPLDDALRVGQAIAKPGNSTRCGGMGMRESAVLCDVFAGASIVSAALGEPTRSAEAVAVVDKLIEAALGAGAQKTFLGTGTTVVGDRKVPKSVLYRGLVLLLLEGREKLAPGSKYAAFSDALAASLVRDLAASPAGWLPTYDTTIWPCDHAPAASALLLHGKWIGDAASKAAGARIVANFGRIAKDGVLPTTVNAQGKVVDAGPRGTVTAWTAGFLLPGDPAAAARFATAFFATFCERPLGIAGCHEWHDDAHPDDVVSGPTMAGFSPGATALARPAARALANDEWSEGLESVVQMGGIDAMRRNVARHPLENAIDQWGRTARAW